MRAFLALTFAIFTAPAWAVTPAQRAVVLSFPPFDSAAITYFNKIVSNGCGARTYKFKRAVSNYIAAERLISNWGTQDAEYILTTASSCVASVNLAQPTLYGLTWSGTCTYSVVNGLRGNSTDCAGDTGVNLSALVFYTQNSAHIGVYVGANSGNSLGLTSALTPMRLSNATNRATVLNSTSVITDTGGGTAGFAWADRTSSSAITTGNGSTVLSNNIANTSTARTAAHITICELNTSFCGSTANIRFVEIGAPVNNETAHSNNIRTLLAALGAQGV